MMSLILCFLLILSLIPAPAMAAEPMTGCNWMSYVDDEASLTALNIPGSHDSGAAFVCCVLKPLAQTQKLSIREQLDAGVRFLDIRIARNKESNELMIVHGVVNTYTKNGKRLKMKDVLCDVEDFLEDNPTETVIISYQAEGGLLDSASSSFYQLVDEMRERFDKDEDKLLINRGAKSPRLGEVRGKAILMKSNVYQKVEDHFESTAAQKWDYLQPYFDNATEMDLSGDAYFTRGYGADSSPRVLYSSCTNGTGLSTNPKKAAKIINPKLMNYSFNAGYYYGWIYMDFVTADLASRIYQTNFAALGSGT